MDGRFLAYRGKDLGILSKGLIEEQLNTWQKLKEAYDALSALKKRIVPFKDSCIQIQFNPYRKNNILAGDSSSTSKMDNCFLCTKNLPKEQKGILWRSFIILPNPAPVFFYHLTVSSLTHRPQRIEGDIENFLDITEDFGSHWAVLYNGHNCGASNPHHMHFQVVLKRDLPIVTESDKENKKERILKFRDVTIHRLKNQGREIFIINGKNKDSMKDTLKRFITALKQIGNASYEPMLNLICLYEDSEFYIIVFPRLRHRPEVFFRKDKPILVSPAVIEMAGVIITVRDEDFNTLDAQMIESIYSDVSLNIPKKTFLGYFLASG